ncbi:hypothetical protein [Kitasatospora sp. NBC_01300]|uniref:hypothetical protein n=1 Tax=Kitasatospora sp. NBC_01300 TaxID=2903574 RepID=UPI002F918377|nr:hypothetical protein OG556_40995 [Kitasatospora sp. NBC_01300]
MNRTPAPDALFAVKWNDAEGRTTPTVSIEGPEFVMNMFGLEEVPTGQVQNRYPAHLLGGRPVITATPIELEWRDLTREEAAEQAAKITGTWWSTVPGGHPLNQESSTAYDMGQTVTLLAAEGSPVAISEHVIGLMYMGEPWLFVSENTPAAWNG